MEEDFYESGKLYSRGYFKRINKNTETSFGLWTYWYENGQKKSEELQSVPRINKYINFWTPDGFQTLTNGNGYLIEKMAFRTEDSTLFNVRDSLKHGRYISYLVTNDTFKKISTGTFKDGLQQGIDTMFFPSGKIYLTRTFVGGEENGKSTKFYENGKIEKQGLLIDIYQEGLWTYYDTIGNITKTVNYLHNNMSGEYYEYYPNGQVKVKGNYIVIRVKNNTKTNMKKVKGYPSSGYGIPPYSNKSFKHDTWLYFSETGELKSKTNYFKGQLKPSGS